MREYHIYKNPSGKIKVVKKGWSWPGFFFTWIWAFVNGIYGLGISILVILLALSLLSYINEMFEVVSLILCFGLFIYLGSKGNDWREYNLCRRGYEKIKFIKAETSEGAIAIFIKEQNNSSDID